MDALEALRPGQLRIIVEKEIKRYFDPDLNANIRAATARVNNALAQINASVELKHEAEIERLRAKHEALAEQIEAFAEKARERFEARFRARLNALAERTEALFHGMTQSLQAEMPDPDAFEWPEAATGDEDRDPLFDSTRDYVEQIDRFKEHQQKPTARRERSGGRP